MHGDDFVVIGMPDQLQWMRNGLEQKYELMVEVLGPDKGKVKEVRVLNWILRWAASGLEYEADPGHVEIMPKQMDIEQCTPVCQRRRPCQAG